IRSPYVILPLAHETTVWGPLGMVPEQDSQSASPFQFSPDNPLGVFKMKIHLLSAALLAGMAVSHVASAQEFDDRWYVAGSVGFNMQDGDRRTDDAWAAGLGLGKFITPEWSVEGELNYQNPSFNHNSDLLWSQYGVSVDFRRHFIAEGRNWAPYVLLGLGYQRSEEEYVLASSSELFQREEGNLAAKLGVGLQADFS